MANRERGEFTLVAGTRRLTLRLTTNAACELEDLVPGQTMVSVYAGLERNSWKAIRLFLWVALRDAHPEIATNDPACLKEIGAIVDECGGIPGLADKVAALMTLNAPEAEDLPKADATTKKPGNPGRPRKARAGTGGRSSSTPSAAA